MNLSLEKLSKTELAAKYIEILQPVEVYVSAFYKMYPEMYDLDVQKVYECLLKNIKAQLTNYPMPKHKLEGISNLLYEQLVEFLTDISKKYLAVEIQSCLKQLEKSLKLWTREHGSRGYLNFIAAFN